MTTIAALAPPGAVSHEPPAPRFGSTKAAGERSAGPIPSRFSMLLEGERTSPAPPLHGESAQGMAGREAHPPSEARPPAPVVPDDGAGLLRVLDASMKAEARLDGLLEEAAQGKAFTPEALLALQAEVYRHAQTIDVISRTTDRLVGGIKQVLNTQV